MKAVRFHGQHDLRYEDVAIPTIKKGQVKIKPAWVGICGSGSFCLPSSIESLSQIPQTYTSISVDLDCVLRPHTRSLARLFP
jgi:NADPH:quinone reductase-like Zn-dependent oxidoreductase